MAVKLPHDEQVDFGAIRNEAEVWEQASGHANVLPIIDADIYNGQVVIVSEYASGGSLFDKLKEQGRFTVREAVETTVGILSGLDFLHRRQIIHRDIKPQNILLQDGTPRLADFGISRAMNTSSMSATVSGTDAYMAPEAFDGKRNVQTDIWSVGVVLYQLLKGSLPFPQQHPTERMFAVLYKEFEVLPDEIPENLHEIIRKSLAKLPANRFQSAREMGEALQTALLQITHPTFAATEVLNNPLRFTGNDDQKPVEDKSVVTQMPVYEIPPTERVEVHSLPPTYLPDRRTDRNHAAADLETQYKPLPLTTPSNPAFADETQLSLIHEKIITWGDKTYIRWPFYFLAMVAGIVTVLGIEILLADVLRLDKPFSNFTLSWVCIFLDMLIFGILGAALGYIFPKGKWTWGLWLNFFTIFYFIYQMNKTLYGGNPGLGGLTLFMFILVLTSPCITAYFGSRLALRNVS